MKGYDAFNLWVSRILIWIAVLASVLPLFFVLAASFSSGEAFFSETLIPTTFTMENYKHVLADTNFPTWMKNSLILAFSVGILQTILTSFSSYAFSRMRFFGRKYGLMSLLLLQMFPNFMAVSAIFGLLVKLNLMDNLFALIFVFAGGNAFNIWLMKGYLDSLPKELDEAATVDGANSWQIFWRIVLPLSLPMLAVVFLFSFIGVFSEFVLSSALLKSPENLTLAVGLQQFIKNEFAANWTQFAAAAVMASIPVVVVFSFMQRWIAGGLMSGSVKG
ncbi:sugar ABC transporter permease [Tumebacillus permanentifrigoris]|uniref:Carbohydrate ABC transporter membrane protein 2 (CUT1 family) n=1 Tax=Tumebacillus permanentifrigoris TaxID=378543 RepID=A0A316DQT4_9BACL|nr:sugar ABC transporter permease [Tumebacillus permanentifrigoris]PWK06002.1 carbohydrate ABC transporter membrane protein 2 (CUT1 family) [Tumebacillus permanentifrigoris]